MPKAATNDELEMRLMLLHEAIWNNGEKIGRVLEHVISHEAEFVRLTRRLEHLLQLLTNEECQCKQLRKPKNA